jgi:hypothetical protein
MASAVLGALPLVFVFLLAQRQIVAGVAGTGLKQQAPIPVRPRVPAQLPAGK